MALIILNDFTHLHFTVVCISKLTLNKLQTNYTPSKSSRSSSIEQDETTIEIPHMKNEVISNRKTQTPDRGVGAGGARAPAETGRSINPIQTRGTDFAPHTTASPPGFKKLSTPLLNCYYQMS